MHLPRPDADGELYPVLVATLPGGEEFTWLLITSFDGRCFWAWSVDRERFETIVVNPGFGAPA